jgi:hypothetical protein
MQLRYITFHDCYFKFVIVLLVKETIHFGFDGFTENITSLGVLVEDVDIYGCLITSFHQRLLNMCICAIRVLYTYYYKICSCIGQIITYKIYNVDKIMHPPSQ